MDTELFSDILEMGFHRFDRDEELLCDFFIAEIRKPGDLFFTL